MKILENIYTIFLSRINLWLAKADCIELGLFVIISLGCLSIGYIIGRKRQYASENPGEALVRQYLMDYCDNKDAHVLNNITIRLEDGSTTQIDHILVSTKGVFVIETKHYRGWIFADAQSKYWTQVIFRVKNKFQNPLFQNYKHVNAVQLLLDFLDKKLIYNFIVFTGDAIFRTDQPYNVYLKEELIAGIEQYADNALSVNRMQFCIGRLEFLRLKLTKETDIEHQMHLMKKFGG